MINKPRILFRADANSQIGLGHLIRSLALAEMLKEKFDISFIIKKPSQAISEYIHQKGISKIPLNDDVSDVDEARYIARYLLNGDELVVLDGYHFKTEYQRIIKSKARKLVCIDDIHSCYFVADVVINHIGGIMPKDYDAEPYTQFFLGMQYALLRKPFRQVAQNGKSGEQFPQQVFVCLGGADPHNATLGVLKKIEQLSFFKKCKLVLGSAYAHRSSLNEYLSMSELDIAVFSNLDAEGMCELMQGCGVAVTPPSSVSYEYLSVGGLLYLQKIASNQNKVYDYLVLNQIAYPFEAIVSHAEIVQHHQVDKSWQIFDGQQAQRFRQIFKQLAR